MKTILLVALWFTAAQWICSHSNVSGSGDKLKLLSLIHTFIGFTECC